MIARLADAADIEKILAARLDLYLKYIDRIKVLRNNVVDHRPFAELFNPAERPGGKGAFAERYRNMRVTAKTNLGELIRKIIDRMISIKDIPHVLGLSSVA